MLQLCRLKQVKLLRFCAVIAVNYTYPVINYISIKYMKRPILLFFLFLLTAGILRAQTVHQVRGIIQDTTGATLPGTSVRLVSATDTLATAANADGTFVFSNVKASEFRLTVSLIGFLTVNRRFIQDPKTASFNVGAIRLKVELNQLQGVTVVGVNPITIKEDTVDFKISAYKVREGAPVEDALRKMPGVDVDKDGNITAQGKAVQRVRVNGKDYFGGDVRTATQNLPADVIESAQIIDDYGDQANLTGIRTGEPDKIMQQLVMEVMLCLLLQPTPTVIWLL
ncbi:MAG: carboxypeptidase regulatory-like domain-containing protein [Sphingobacteriaceae bacterium]|nr:MAG: carboxypeptidase regulatory-like domain-containing protein [Sphingobacteriaceae bacterium]